MLKIIKILWNDKDAGITFKFWLACVVAALLLVILAASQGELAHGQKIIERPSSISNELIELRTANSETYNICNGKRLTHVHTQPKYYKNITTGKYEAISTPTVDSFKGYYSFTHLSHSVSYTPLFNIDDIEIINNKSNTGIKQTIILKNDKAPTKLTWQVNTNAIIEYNNGQLIFTDNNGDFLFRTLKPRAWDENNNDISIKVTYINSLLIYELDVSKPLTYPVTVDPTTTMQVANDGGIYKSDNIYNTARDATDGTNAVTNFLQVGQRPGTPIYVNRVFLSFAIPKIGTCLSGSFFINGSTDISTDNFDIYIHTSTYTAIQTADFELFDGWTSGSAHDGTILNDSWNSDDYSVGWNECVFNAAGLAAILAKQNGTFKIVLISKEDYDRSAPANDERIVFNSSEAVGFEPYLSLVYTTITARYNLYNKEPQYLWKDGDNVPLWNY